VGATGGAQPFSRASQSDGSLGSSLGDSEVGDGVEHPVDAQLLADISHPGGQALLEHVVCADLVAFGEGNSTQTEQHQCDKARKAEGAIERQAFP